MLTTQFLNLSCSVLLDDSTRDSEIAKDIKEILEFYENKNDEIPLEIKDKFDLCKVLVQHVENGDDTNIIIDSILTSKKFNNLHSFIQAVSEKNLDESQRSRAKEQISKRKKLASILTNYDELVEFINNFETNSFDSLDDVLDNYSGMIKKLYDSYNTVSRKENIETSSSLDLFNDDFDPIVQELGESFSGSKSITSGYEMLDKYMFKGFEPRRLYIFGGSSGDGKSTLLVNLLNNVMSSSKTIESDKKDIYIYFTFENLLTESLGRLYCCSKELDFENFKENFNSYKKDITTHIKSVQKNNNKVVSMEYFSPKKATVSDLLSKADEVKNRYEGEGKLRGIFIDYLDLLRSIHAYEIPRFELGQITLDLKVLSIFCDCPVITVTQLNRQSYDKDVPLGLTQIGESIQKVEHADFIAMLRSLSGEEETDDHVDKIMIEIDKNRSGPKNRKLYLKADFSKYKLYDLKQQVDVPKFENQEKEEIFGDSDIKI